jgi:hypothetical protein
MAPLPADIEPDSKQRGSLTRRAFVTLLAFMMLTLPLLVAINLSTSSQEIAAVRGDQPGGLIEGRVLDHEGQPIGHHMVHLSLTGPSSEVLHEVQTDAYGSFRFEAPPAAQASYRLRVGGGSWRWQAREVGFLGSDGELIEGGLQADFDLQLGAVLVLEVLGKSGSPMGHAEVCLTGQWVESGLLRFAPRILDQTRSFSGSPMILDGLPPMQGRVSISLDGGRVISFDLELPVGQTIKRIQL